MPTETLPERKSITVKINNIDYIKSLVHTLNETYKEMIDINVNNTPVKYSTKARWEEAIKQAHDYLQKFIPREKE